MNCHVPYKVTCHGVAHARHSAAASRMPPAQCCLMASGLRFACGPPQA